ncbi:MAG: AMP-binding protein [Candidatus Tectomicrobia bacterium]|nr:AMP-binding protein [Candidatus Tectomicrobia bacterium]
MRAPEVHFYAPEVETLPPCELTALQLRKFRRLLERALSRNVFYRRKFKDAGVDPARVRTLEDVRRLPTTSKAEVLADIEAHLPYGERLQVPEREVVQVVETSGTSGNTREVYGLSRGDMEAACDMEACGFFWAGVRPGVAVFNTLPMHTSAAGLWYYHGLRKLDANVFQVGTFDAQRKVEYLRRFAGEFLIASPSYIRRLLSAAREMGLDPRSDLKVRRLLVAGEPYPEAWIREQEAAWGAKVFEQYGSTQRAMAWSCERGVWWEGQRGVLHTLPHRVLFEILDLETREPVGPGEWGELVVTPLDTEASPLIRFATGDRVRYLPAEACGCGRTFPGIEAGTVSRVDNMLRVKGVNLWPQAVDGVVFRFREVREYRGEVALGIGDREEIRVRVELDSGLSPGEGARLCARLAEELRAALVLRFEVSLWDGPSLCGSFREGLHKSQRWTDLRPR